MRSRAGQIVIPAMLIFPTLFLFVYLIYETAKLSREKIRHQFAVDAAAFVEMTNYSDFLNRTAYVNGAFPMRIFEEGYNDFYADCEGKTPNCNANGKKSYAKLLYDNGAFPHVGAGYVDGHAPEKSDSEFPNPHKWNIEYGGNGTGKNSNPPDMTAVPTSNTPDFALFTEDDAVHYWHTWELATDIYKLYVQIYSLLGSVEDAQYQVLTRLTTGGGVPHSFLQKSYWMNTGDPVGDANGLARSFDLALGDFPHAVQANCLKKLDYWGNKHLNGGIQPYVPIHTVPSVDLTANGGAGCGAGGGLFQIESLSDDMAKKLQTGLTVETSWSIPNKNFFNVDFVSLMTQNFPNRGLHTTISLRGDPANFPSVWPDPTPKFQVRQFP